MEKKRLFNYQVDFINGNIFSSLVLFAVPIFISNIFQQLYNTADVMVVGNVLGDTSLAAVGSTTAIYDLLLGFCLGIGSGLSIVTARSFVSKNKELLKKSIASALIIRSVVSILVTIIAHFILYPLLEILGTPADIV